MYKLSITSAEGRALQLSCRQTGSVDSLLYAVAKDHYTRVFFRKSPLFWRSLVDARLELIVSRGLNQHRGDILSLAVSDTVDRFHAARVLKELPPVPTHMCVSN